MVDYKTNKGIVELCMTYRCNVRCANCSNLCTQAPARGDLTANDIAYFISDSDTAGHRYGLITLHGGEPVLCPDIEDIIKLLIQYRERTGCKLWLLTNNSTDEIRRRITRYNQTYSIPLGVSTKIDGKNINAHGDPIDYIPVNESPEDVGNTWTVGCFQTSNCGICFNYDGYFPCSPIAAAARVFGYRGMQSINDLTEEVCEKYFREHCRHCGFAVKSARRVTEQVTSASWKRALAVYNQKKG